MLEREQKVEVKEALLLSQKGQSIYSQLSCNTGEYRGASLSCERLEERYAIEWRTGKCANRRSEQQSASAT